jgi:hypothetical protein
VLKAKSYHIAVVGATGAVGAELFGGKDGFVSK